MVLLRSSLWRSADEVAHDGVEDDADKDDEVEDDADTDDEVEDDEVATASDEVEDADDEAVIVET